MENLTTQDSLKIIEAVINQRKRKYEENGKFLLFWGVLIMVAGIAQFIMVKMGYRHLVGYAWLFTMLPGFIFTYISAYRDRKKALKDNKKLDNLGQLWNVAGIMAFATGFFFGHQFGAGFTAMLFTPFCMAAMASALILKNNFWIFLNVIAIVLLYLSAFVPFSYFPLIAALVAFLIFLLPGLQLYLNHKKRQNV